MRPVSTGNRPNSDGNQTWAEFEVLPLLSLESTMQGNKVILTTRPTTSGADELRQRRATFTRSSTNVYNQIALPGSLMSSKGSGARPSTSSGHGKTRRLGSSANWKNAVRQAMNNIQNIDEIEETHCSNVVQRIQLSSLDTEEEEKADDVALIQKKDGQDTKRSDKSLKTSPKRVQFNIEVKVEHLGSSMVGGKGVYPYPRSEPGASTGMSREQHAFLNRYGMRLEDADQQQGVRFEGGFVKFLREDFIVDPTHDYSYYWNGVVAFVYLYNLFFVPYRCVFLIDDVPHTIIFAFLLCDIISDIVYLIDLFIRARTGYLEQGLLVRDKMKTWQAYRKSWLFYADVLGTIPLDYFCELALWSPNPFLRFNRLIKLDRIQNYINATETRISIPNVFRITCVVMYILVLIHWNACFYFLVSIWIGIGTDSWVYGYANTQALPPGIEDSWGRQYIYCFYWSTLMLTTVGEVPWPVRSIELVIVIVDLMCGVLIFATIVGNVGTMISNMSAARSDFQNKVDGIKKYMEMRNISAELEERVIKWFDYLWSNKQTISDQHVLRVLPTKLQAEIAMHVHFETLRKVRIFQDCEAGLLAELVLKLELQVFSPDDYVCRKGDIGREMYIVKKGRLQVVNDDGTQVFHTLQEGAVFGELSILNIAGSKQGNRRSASIRSVGYTDLFVLKKTDLWEALQEYPDARKVLIQKGKEILMKDNLLDETLANEQRPPEELAAELQEYVSELQTRLARLTAQTFSNEVKLQKRIDDLERELRIQDEGFFDEAAEMMLMNDEPDSIGEMSGRSELESERDADEPGTSGLQTKKNQ